MIYSGLMGASALLENGEIMTANNQENMALQLHGAERVRCIIIHLLS